MSGLKLLIFKASSKWATMASRIRGINPPWKAVSILAPSIAIAAAGAYAALYPGTFGKIVAAVLGLFAVALLAIFLMNLTLSVGLRIATLAGALAASVVLIYFAIRATPTTQPRVLATPVATPTPTAESLFSLGMRYQERFYPDAILLTTRPNVRFTTS